MCSWTIFPRKKHCVYEMCIHFVTPRRTFCGWLSTVETVEPPAKPLERTQLNNHSLKGFELASWESLLYTRRKDTELSDRTIDPLTGNLREYIITVTFPWTSDHLLSSITTRSLSCACILHLIFSAVFDYSSYIIMSVPWLFPPITLSSGTVDFKRICGSSKLSDPKSLLSPSYLHPLFHSLALLRLPWFLTYAEFWNLEDPVTSTTVHRITVSRVRGWARPTCSQWLECSTRGQRIPVFFTNLEPRPVLRNHELDLASRYRANTYM